MKLIRIVTVGQHLSNVLQRRSICGINERSKIGIGLSPGFSPDPKCREQSRSMVNEIVRGVHNKVVRRIRRCGPDACPDLLLRLLLELTESAHASAVFHRASSAITRGLEPADARELAGQIAKDSRPRTQRVAGYDLTFSPVKSVSTLWAIADPAVAAVIEQALQAAVNDALAFIERHALFTRTGPQGIRQVNVQGLVAAAFTHRDSRAGDLDVFLEALFCQLVGFRGRRGRRAEKPRFSTKRSGVVLALDLKPHWRQ
jgi:hypothetical protein